MKKVRESTNTGAVAKAGYHQDEDNSGFKYVYDHEIDGKKLGHIKTLERPKNLIIRLHLFWPLGIYLAS